MKRKHRTQLQRLGRKVDLRKPIPDFEKLFKEGEAKPRNPTQEERIVQAIIERFDRFSKTHPEINAELIEEVSNESQAM